MRDRRLSGVEDGQTGRSVRSCAILAAKPVLRQGFLEDSNVDPVLELSRMVEVQRAYELGQSFLDQEDQRICMTITSLTR